MIMINQMNYIPQWRWLGIFTVLCLVCSPVSAAKKAKLLQVEIFPPAIVLEGVREEAQLVITGHYSDGSIRDLTREAEITSSNEQVAVILGSVVVPVENGSADINIKLPGKKISTTVTVSNQDKPQSVSFLYDTLAALSKNNCNAGACHGSPSGKAGFRLSLRAFDPKLDELTLIREDFGRRTNALDADNSLLLLKPLMKVAHGGGRQIRTDDPAYAVVRDWIAEGCNIQTFD